MYVCVCVCPEVRGQLPGVGTVLQNEFWRLNSGHQAWQQSPSGLSHWRENESYGKARISRNVAQVTVSWRQKDQCEET